MVGESWARMVIYEGVWILFTFTSSAVEILFCKGSVFNLKRINFQGDIV